MQVEPHQLLTRIVSIPAATLVVVVTAVVLVSKLSIAAASDSVPHSVDPAPTVKPIELPIAFEGIASYYAHKFHGRRTAHGSRFNMYDFTAAHRALPFGTILRVTNPSTGACLLVQVNDRGPYVRRRVLDLSYAAAEVLGVQLGRIRAEGITPQDIAADSTVLLFIGASYQPYRAETAAIEVVQTFDKFSTALRAHRMHINEPDVALAVLPLRDGDEVRLSYAVVRLSPRALREDSLALLSP